MPKIVFEKKTLEYNRRAFGTENGAACQVCLTELVVLPSGSVRIDEIIETFYMTEGNKIVLRHYDERCELVETELDASALGISPESHYEEVLSAGIRFCTERLKLYLIASAEKKILALHTALEGEIEFF